MVAIDDDLAVGDVGDAEDMRLSIVPVLVAHALELHADLDVRGKAVLRFHANEFGVVVAEGVRHPAVADALRGTVRVPAAPPGCDATASATGRRSKLS